MGGDPFNHVLIFSIICVNLKLTHPKLSASIFIPFKIYVIRWIK